MRNWFKNIFKSKPKTPPTKKIITVGEPDENGFCDSYVNGVKSKVKLLVFTKKQTEKLFKIIYENEKN